MAQPPAFDVASVRASESGKGEGGWRDQVQASPGSLIMRNVTLKSAMAWAYHVMEYQVAGPEWTGQDRYNISAKGGATDEQMRLMLRTLLTERFAITIHRQTKELQAYVLTVGKGGPKFHESQEDGEPVINPDKAKMTVDVKAVPASKFIDMLSQVLHMPVINQTGLTGRYDMTFNVAKYLPDGTTPFDPVATILVAVQEEMGLKLEAKKVALDLVIIDRAERVPLEN